jgi:hypothetical protein
LAYKVFISIINNKIRWANISINLAKLKSFYVVFVNMSHKKQATEKRVALLITCNISLLLMYITFI